MANTRFDNIVLENKLTDQLSTRLDALGYCTVDDTMALEAGMIKHVHVYGYTGAAQTLAEGVGNTVDLTMSYDNKPYTVQTVQARFVYTDEDQMSDPFLVDGGISNINVALTNAITAAVIGEWEDSNNEVKYSSAPSYNDFVDALAMLNIEEGASDQVFALCNPSMKAALRKGCKDDMKYVESLAGAGYIGSIAGVPVHAMKAIPDDEIIIATKEAVTFYRKKSAEIEQKREPNTRTNEVYGRIVGVAALTNAAKVAIITKNNLS